MNIYEDFIRAKKVNRPGNRQVAIKLISHQTVACFSQGLYQVWGCYTTYMQYTVKTSITFRAKTYYTYNIIRPFITFRAKSYYT